MASLHTRFIQPHNAPRSGPATVLRGSHAGTVSPLAAPRIG